MKLIWPRAEGQSEVPRSSLASAVRWTALTLALGAGGYALWSHRGGSDAPVSFRTAKVGRGSVEQVVTATGALNAVVTVQVGTQVSGTIQKLGADFNDRVKEGQVIAQIEPTRFKANLDQAMAALKTAEAAEARAKVALAQAKVELDRARDLAARGVAGQAELDLARSKNDQAMADLAAAGAQISQARATAGVARIDLEHTTIRAPISGVVLSRAVDVGQTVAASLAAPTLFSIAQDLTQMEVRAAIDEADVGKLHESQDARFTVDAYPGQEFRATIHQIRSQPNVQQNVVTYDAILRVDNKDGRLRPGMTATVRVVCEKHDNVLRVPNAALRFKPSPLLVEAGEKGPGDKGPPGGAAAGGRPPGGGGGEEGGRRKGGRISARVYRQNGSKVVPVPFKPGISDDEFTELLSGSLAEGDEIVIEAVGGPTTAPAAGANPTRGRGPRFF